MDVALPPTDDASERAATAMLRLQARAAASDADAAERDLAAAMAAARGELIVRLARLQDERRAVLEQMLERERVAAAESIALARQQAAAPSMPSSDDAEMIARVCAATVAAMLEQGFGGAPMAAAPTPKPSFWRNLFHVDIVLIGVAAVIVALVLVAWMG